MKKSYMKPELSVELFEVDTIMTGEDQTPSVTPSDILTNNTTLDIESAGTISFTDGNTLNSINYKSFLK